MARASSNAPVGANNCKIRVTALNLDDKIVGHLADAREGPNAQPHQQNPEVNVKMHTARLQPAMMPLEANTAGAVAPPAVTNLGPSYCSIAKSN
eukprot:11156127-Lingulodinium_polyedra.AAC.1